MAYVTGASSGLSDLLVRLRGFAEGIGWSTTAVNSTTWAFTSPQGGSFTLQLTANNASYRLFGATQNLPGVLMPTAQPGNSETFHDGSLLDAVFVPGSSGPYTRHHFFGTLQYLHVVLEVQASVFAHLHIGRLNKRGTQYAGGEYIQGHRYNAVHTQIFDPAGRLGNWTGRGTSPWTEGNSGIFRAGGFDGAAEVRWTNQAVGLGKGVHSINHPDIPLAGASLCEYLDQPIVVPNRILLRAGTSQGDLRRARVLGETQDLGIVDITRHAPGDVVIYGEDEWVVFPMYRKGPEIYNYSVNNGFAYLVRD